MTTTTTAGSTTVATPTPGPKGGGAPRLDYLDGVRASAALYVILIHAWTSQMGEAAHVGLLGWASNWILYGHTAVDMFIVLSGFCLVLPVARHGTLRGGALQFFRRRAWRILPTFYAALALCAVLRLIELHVSPEAKGITLPGLVVNVLLLQDLFQPGQNLPQPSLGRQLSGPFWSVAVEWKIYFLFPVIAWLLTRRSPLSPLSVLLFTAAVGYGVTGLLLWHDPKMPLEYTCPWYTLLFGMGVCAGYVTHTPGRAVSARAWAVVGTTSLLAYAWMIYLWPITPADITPHAVHTIWSDVPAGAACAAALALMSCGAARARALFSWTPLVRLGTFSYSLYLIHSALLKVCEAGLRRAHLHGLPAVSVLLAVGVPLIIGAAYLFFLAFERPFLTRRPGQTLAETATQAALSPAP